MLNEFFIKLEKLQMAFKFVFFGCITWNDTYLNVNLLLLWVGKPKT